MVFGLLRLENGREKNNNKNTHVPPFNIKLVLIALSFSKTNVASFSVLVTLRSFPQNEKKSVNLDVVVSGERPVTCNSVGRIGVRWAVGRR
jgi:hypothetical protein